MNQGFFAKLFIAEDGSVEDAELRRLFAGLYASDSGALIRQRNARAARALGQRGIELQTAGIELTATGTDGPAYGFDVLPTTELKTNEHNKRQQRRYSLTSVLLGFTGQKQTRPELSFGPSLNKTTLAETGGFEPPVEFCPTLH